MRPLCHAAPAAACVAAVFALLGCAGTGAPVRTVPPVQASRPQPAVAPDDDLNATLWTQRAVEHDMIFREVYRDAHERLLAALADPAWDALPRDERAGASVDGLPPAVILDIDETALDNSPYQARLIRSGEEYSEFTWSQWCKEEVARPLPGADEFARFAADHGVRVYYLSNRAKDLDVATLDNLRQAGFPVADGGVFLGLGALLPGCEQIGTEKGCRRRIVGRDHRVLMQFGDQLGDFIDVLSNTPDGRSKAIAPYADWFGERWWMLPNPTYGSWEPAQFDNNWQQTREERRRRKIDALRDH
jgi:5'-nucleotidase (lipoprotein e(P4) family)